MSGTKILRPPKTTRETKIAVAGYAAQAAGERLDALLRFILARDR